MKSVLIENPKTSYKLSKTIRQGEKVSQLDSSKSSDTTTYSNRKQK